MTDGRDDFAALMHRPDRVLDHVVVRQIPHRAVAARKVDCLVVAELGFVERPRIVERCLHARVVQEFCVVALVLLPAARVDRRRAARGCDKVNRETGVRQDGPGFRGFREVKARLVGTRIARLAQTVVTGEYEQNLVLLH